MPDEPVGRLRRRWRAFRSGRLLPDASRRGRAYLAFRRAVRRTIDRVDPPATPTPAFVDPAVLEARLLGGRARARAEAHERYRVFIKRFEPGARAFDIQREAAARWTDGPRSSVVTPVFAPPLETFRATADSLLAQT